MNAILERLGREFDITDVVARKPDGFFTLKIDKDSAETLIRELRDREGFTHLNFMTCIDYIEQGIFTLVYMLQNHERRLTLGIHVDIPRDQPVMTSIHKLWAQAWTYQRELREMYGIDYPGSPRLEEDFCLEGWDGPPPMRREFNTATFSAERFGEREGRHSEEPREHMHTAIYPERGGDK